jgi:hypothetical protein
MKPSARQAWSWRDHFTFGKPGTVTDFWSPISDANNSSYQRTIDWYRRAGDWYRLTRRWYRLASHWYRGTSGWYRLASGWDRLASGW